MPLSPRLLPDTTEPPDGVYGPAATPPLSPIPTEPPGPPAALDSATPETV